MITQNDYNKAHKLTQRMNNTNDQDICKFCKHIRLKHFWEPKEGCNVCPCFGFKEKYQ